MFGVAVVAATIGLSANVALGLWVRSTVDSVAYDAATWVASADTATTSPRALERTAIDNARELLGEYGHQVSLAFIDDGDPMTISLHVRAPGVSMLPRMFGGGPVVGSIDRIITVGREQS